ncbi:STAS domain-containing protein [Anabaena sp. UHCC 0451]|nr:STAS domain-containing protein [Anabaena sp. UHCC 0451]MEA5575058.1 STAS domain-containing protein [Anabaena sp. UHCC 0451]
MNINQKTYSNPEGNTVIVLKPTGRLDITTAWQFRLKLQECISKLSRHVLVNLGEVNFIDSSGLTSLVAGMRDADKVKGSFRICNVHPEAKLVFEVTMMDTVFEIFETEEEALEALFPNLVNSDNKSSDHKHQNTQENSNSPDLSSQSARFAPSLADE